MKKYFLIARGIMQETFMYRLSFVMWRVRGVFFLLTLYFLWIALIPKGQSLFGYSQSLILTYIMLGNIVGSFVFSTRTTIFADEINNGDLSNSLVKPLNYFWRIYFIDVGDKLVNILFAAAEFSVLFLILKPPFILQTNPSILFFFVVSVIMAIHLHFFIQMLLGSVGFWSNEVWAPRFIFGILLQFFSGVIIPLDILPQSVYSFFMVTPFPYLLYFPLKIYLGQINIFDIFQGLFIASLWTVASYFVLRLVWNKGIKSYSAQGR